MFMTAVVAIYIFAEPQLALGRFIPYYIAIIIGLSVTLLLSGFYIYKLLTKREIKQIEGDAK